MGRPKKQTEESVTKSRSTQNSSLEYANRKAYEDYRSLSLYGVEDKVKFWESAVERAATQALPPDYPVEVAKGHVAWCKNFLDIAKAVRAEKMGAKPKRRRASS